MDALLTRLPNLDAANVNIYFGATTVVQAPSRPAEDAPGCKKRSLEETKEPVSKKRNCKFHLMYGSCREKGCKREHPDRSKIKCKFGDRCHKKAKGACPFLHATPSPPPASSLPSHPPPPPASQTPPLPPPAT